MKTLEKEMETKIIFCERDKENRERDLRLMEQKGDEIMKRVQEAHRSSEEIALRTSEQQTELAKVNELIQASKQ
jgi:exosome complex RNA-binding protein Rrp4